MSAPCGVTLHVCRMRVTQLDDLGNTVSTPDNFYVTSAIITVGLTPNIAQGADLELRGGCDCVLASYRGVDSLKRFDFEVALGKMEPALQAMLIDGTVIDGTDGTTTVPIGVAYPSPLSCDDTPSNVAFEFWTDNWTGDSLDPDWPYIHHIFPQSRWAPGPITYGNDFGQPGVTGYSKQNLAWDDPYGDGPGVAVTYGAWFYSADPLPDSECAFQTV